MKNGFKVRKLLEKKVEFGFYKFGKVWTKMWFSDLRTSPTDKKQCYWLEVELSCWQDTLNIPREVNALYFYLICNEKIFENPH